MTSLADTILLYHLTHINNLPSILQRESLWSHACIKTHEVSYSDVANQDVQTRRERTKIPIGMCGNLHDYVPFYFAPRSPMLYVIGRQHPPQQNMVYFMTSTAMIQQHCPAFVFTDAHAIRRLTNFYEELTDLDKIDWPIMKATIWTDTDEDPNRKARRQAEFLVHNEVPLKACLGFAVYDEQIKHRVEQLLQQNGISLPVAVRRPFYF